MNQVRGIEIKNLAVYHPETVRDNQYYVDYYGEKGFFAQMIAEETFGRDKRYVVMPDSNETSISMAIEASKMALKKEGITGEDIDIICFCSFSAEFVSPPGALMIHDAIKGKERTLCYDLNANCVGMVYGLEQLSKYMKVATDAKRALLVGAECLSRLFAPQDIANNVCYGDSACAVILEKSDDESKTIDTDYYVESYLWDHARSPMCGLSKSLSAPVEERYYYFQPPETSIAKSALKIKEMLQEHNLKVSDIKMFLTSQFAKPMAMQLLDDLGATEEQRIYVGDRFGYTGANSPFICLDEVIKEGRVQKGDYIVMWTLGASVQYVLSLIRF